MWCYGSYYKVFSKREYGMSKLSSCAECGVVNCVFTQRNLKNVKDFHLYYCYYHNMQTRMYFNTRVDFINVSWSLLQILNLNLNIFMNLNLVILCELNRKHNERQKWLGERCFSNFIILLKKIAWIFWGHASITLKLTVSTEHCKE